MREQLSFEKLSELRQRYFVEYQPPVADNTFATSNLVFLDLLELASVATFMQAEMDYWLRRYPVPLMMWGWDAKENMLHSGPAGESCLVGWVEPHDGQVTRSWSINDLTQRLKTIDVNIDWREIYKDVAFKTQDQIRLSATRELVQIRRRNRYLKFILVFWLAVIPAGWALIQYMGPDWLALIVVIYAVVQAIRAGGRIFRNTRPSPTEGAKAKKQLKMDHYYYHCERNPAGFSRLEMENFEKDAAEVTANEAAALAKSPGND